MAYVRDPALNDFANFILATGGTRANLGPTTGPALVMEPASESPPLRR